MLSGAKMKYIKPIKQIINNWIIIGTKAFALGLHVHFSPLPMSAPHTHLPYFTALTQRSVKQLYQHQPSKNTATTAMAYQSQEISLLKHGGQQQSKLWSSCKKSVFISIRF
jgi:hypothetical protein